MSELPGSILDGDGQFSFFSFRRKKFIGREQNFHVPLKWHRSCVKGKHAVPTL